LPEEGTKPLLAAQAECAVLRQIAEHPTMTSYLPYHPSRGAAAAVFALALAGAYLLAPGPAAAQLNGTYGADNGACDRTALQSILSPTKGNIIGSLGGAALGGIVGNQFGGGGGKGLLTAVGVVGGALAGGYVGRQMDPADHACVGRTLENTPTGQTVAWHDPQKDSSYWVTPTNNFQGANGEACRNFNTQAVIDGRTQQVAGTACRQPDGSWRTVNGGAAAPANPIGPDTVVRVQQKLHDQGFYVRDNIDGKWGPRTSAAVLNYQRAKGLQPTGAIDPATLAALDLAPTAQQMPPVAMQNAPNPPSYPAWAPPQ
jgi:surface antigen